MLSSSMLRSTALFVIISALVSISAGQLLSDELSTNRRDQRAQDSLATTSGRDRRAQDALARARRAQGIFPPKVVGSSGAHAQMVFVRPFTNNVVFVDSYHPNFGKGVNLITGAHGKEPFTYENSDKFVFGTEYDLTTNEIRALEPISNTFCSAGAFFPDGTLLNTGGAEACRLDGNCFDGSITGPVLDGFQQIRTFAPGPCPTSGCTSDWVEVKGNLIQSKRWYHSMQTLTDGSILLVGGSNVGGLVYNEAAINEASFETVLPDGKLGPLEKFPFLEFTDEDKPGKSYNLYPILHLLPNEAGANEIFTLRGNDAIIFDYEKNKQVKALPKISGTRTFPGSAMSVLLPLSSKNNYTAEVLVCGGSTGDAPNPKALDSCGRINPRDPKPKWEMDDMPDGERTMGDMVLLPDGQVFIVNGARKGSAGGHMAEDPAFGPLLYNPRKSLGRRFNVNLPASKIPRMYHSVATLIPSGEVLVAGSNPTVVYREPGTSVGGGGYPKFFNNGKPAKLLAQQSTNSTYPTEYRVELFSPPYMGSTNRPVIGNLPREIVYDGSFEVEVDVPRGRSTVITIQLIHPGFATHGVHMGQRMVELDAALSDGSSIVTAFGPPNPSIMPPGVYLLFAVHDGIPSEGKWVKLTLE